MRILIAIAALGSIMLGSIMPANAAYCYQNCTTYGNSTSCYVNCY